MRDKNQFYTDEEWEEQLKIMAKPFESPWEKFGFFIGVIIGKILLVFGLDEYSQWKKTGKRRNK